VFAEGAEQQFELDGVEVTDVEHVPALAAPFGSTWARIRTPTSLSRPADTATERSSLLASDAKLRACMSASASHSADSTIRAVQGDVSDRLEQCTTVSVGHVHPPHDDVGVPLLDRLDRVGGRCAVRDAPSLSVSVERPAKPIERAGIVVAEHDVERRACQVVSS